MPAVRLLELAWLTVLGIGLCVALIEPRGLGWHSIAESLWTEDAMVFLNQAYSIGLQSVVTPYQGYMHTFQRLITLVAARVPLPFAPHLLFLGACLALALLALVVERRLRTRGLGVTWISIALAMVLLQPHSGEVFFSITNTQWILGLALALYLGLPESDPESSIELVVLGIASLTGPFSLLLLPVLCLQLVHRSDWRSRRKTYLTVAGCALVQFTVLMNSNRLRSSGAVRESLTDWMAACWKFLSFGGANNLVVTAAIAYWTLVVVTALHRATRSHSPAGRQGGATYLFLAAVVLFGTSLYSVSLWSSVTSISPIGGGARYYFVPYGLLLVGALVSLRSSAALCGLLTVTTAIICIQSFSPGRRYNMQWPAYARFAAVHQGIEIPINPQWRFLPTWQVIPPRSATVGTAPFHSISFSPSSNKEVPGFELDIGATCSSSEMVGLEISAWHGAPGLVTLEWGTASRVIGTGNRLQRFYPGGPVKMQFAVERVEGETFFRLSPDSGGLQTKLEAVTLFCL